ncbi:MAG: 1,4-alpha-glucan branching protein GlgB [Gemmatimonadota bacterium]|nr:1,4-alpha-glucan branching protein GlgB [Gemmatimonadota bacterium]MDQ8172082.1 1,4-alpha-glucan branching protein GlgB [Gemmatimonadota bacterium]
MILPIVSADAALRLVRGESAQPHDLLGAHTATQDGVEGVVVRVFQPNAASVAVVLGAHQFPMVRDEYGCFVLFLSDRAIPLAYRLAVTYGDGRAEVRDDPYRFLPALGDVDLHLFNEGRHLRLWEKLGAHPREMDGVSGTSFAVWAPNAARVSVIGSFNDWDGRAHQMRVLDASGVFELFVPGVGAEAMYKFELRTADGALRVKTDPYAFKMEQGPGHAAIVQAPDRYVWRDGAWLARRADADPLREPMLVYEVHLSSWMRGEHNRLLSYTELAPRLAEHCRRLGFTHVELLPILEHPFGGSWGYQVGGYFAPTSRHGSPDEFRAFVDTMHEAGIGVLLDWVPAHFPKDDWALRRFDGTACYEHEDPRLGDHPEWGTHIFNYARHEVRNFLLANALYWIEAFHIDGLRVDAVASMLYLDYGREAGQWLRNRYGGRENLEAVSFLKQLNHAVHSLHPGVITVAEESTAWPKVTHPISEGGLGFTLKWNMGWMHDTLDYFKVDPFFRKGAHDKLTFAMMYEYSERFTNPLSHDEVVHLKKSLVEKMPGDVWQRFANLRALIGYSVTRPGKSLFFMGTELGSHHEWNHDLSLEWHLLGDARRQGLMAFMEALGALYRQHACFWRLDHEPSGFGWIDVTDKEQSVLSYARYDGGAHAVVVLSLTPVPRDAYRLGAPSSGTYHVVLNSDAAAFGGSGYTVAETVESEPVPYHGFGQSITVSLPPLSMLVLLPANQPVARAPMRVEPEPPVKAPKAPKPTKPTKAPKAPKALKATKPAKGAKPAKAAKPTPTS